MIFPNEIVDEILLYLPLHISITLVREHPKRILLKQRQRHTVHSTEHAAWLLKYDIRGNWATQAYLLSAQAGNKTLMQRIENKFPAQIGWHTIDEGFKIAINSNLIDVAQHLCATHVKHQSVYLRTWALEYAIQHQRSTIFPLLYRTIGSRHCGSTIPRPLMNMAALYGNLSILRFLHAQGERCTGDAMLNAAKYNHIDVVRFLSHIGTECTTRVMDFAARFGHLDVVRFLHDNNVGGCTTDAMDWAARFGHSAVFYFLHTHRTEGYTDKAIHAAIKNGHIGILKIIERIACTESE